MKSPYIKLPFTIANGATASSEITPTVGRGSDLAIARVEIIGTLTANTGFIEESDSSGGTFVKTYDVYGTQQTFAIAGDRMHQLKLQDYAVMRPVIRVGLSAAASGAVTGYVYLRNVS